MAKRKKRGGGPPQSLLDRAGAEVPRRKVLDFQDIIDGPADPVRALRIELIEPRAGMDTRPLDARHVIALAESIAALGLLEPVVIDNERRLLAGGHRLAACKLLLTPQEARGARLLELCVETRESITPEMMQAAQELPTGRDVDLDAEKIPARVIDFDSEDDLDRALAIEASENERRKDYTPKEIKALYHRLIERGYTDKRGRPAPGERPARPAIALVIGKSERYVRKVINTPTGEEKKPAAVPVSSEQRDREALIKAAERYLERHTSTTRLGAHTLKVLRKALEALRAID